MSIRSTFHICYSYNILNSCDFGWKGPLCDQCIKLQGCSEYGTCKDNAPFTCECNSSDWLGPLCDCPKCRAGNSEPVITINSCK